MGNSQSVRGLKMMEAIYPSENGRSIFEDPKLKAKLDKEITKGRIKPDSHDDEEPVDGDMDMIIARVVKEVWDTYDTKNTGTIDKKACEKFFKDALQVYALRNGHKSSGEMVPKNVNQSNAMKEAVSKLMKGNPRCSYQDFEDFLFTYDIEEVLAPFFGRTDGLEIDYSKVQKIDTASFQSQQQENLRPVYRDYPDD